MTRDHNARNRAGRERISAVIARLGDRDQTVGDDWTAAALLGHIAFWDRLAAARLEKYVRDGEPPPTANDAITDLTNAAGMRQWKETPTRVAAAQAKDAAAAIDKLIEALPAEKLTAIKAMGRPLLLDRSIHRKQHLDEIERALE
jgi:DinB superfamily